MRENNKFRRSVTHLAVDESAVAFIEFAYLLPVFIALCIVGLEMTAYQLAHTRINQLTITLADNASRAKQDVSTGVPPVREVDINEMLAGTLVQAEGMDFETQGRAILSSLEVNPEGGQWVHWQRCLGKKNYTAQLGKVGDGKTGTSYTGMGPKGRKITVQNGYAIMFVELAYDYRPFVISTPWTDKPIIKYAASYVRDPRALVDPTNPSPTEKIKRCSWDPDQSTT